MKTTKYYFFFSFMLFVITTFSQRGKEGTVTINTANRIVNEYTALTADATSGATSISVAASNLNANGRFTAALSSGDLIMIIQMQGASILGQPDAFTPAIGSPNDATWGSITNYNNCGKYEFCQVAAVTNSTTITIDCGLINDYTASGKVQVVRVPRYNTLTIASPGILTCQAWNGSTGGVLAVEVAGNTILTAGGKINTTGKGFRGAALFSTTGRTTTTIYSCVSLDVGANKGEGIAGYDTDYTPFGGKYCRAAPANAGGGGNVWNCGGGGGANAGLIALWNGQGNPDNSVAAYTTAWNLESVGFSSSSSSGGGRGGYSFSSSNQNATTLGPGTIGVTNAWGGSFRYNLGGLGGRPLDYSTGKLFMGGGGGAGEQDNNRSGSGGNGGGIIFFNSYGSITGSGNDSIISDGNNGGNTLVSGSNSGNDGAGGAGGGGTIILNAVGTITGVAIRANGGEGGDQLKNANQLFYPLNETEGPGGGGGGGYIAVSNGSTPAQQADGGANGITTSSQLSEFPPNGATKGGAGLINQLISWDTIQARDTTICSGTSVTISANLYGNVPLGTTIVWYSSQIAGSIITTGATFTTPVLNSTTTYYVGFCPGTYRIPVIINVITAPNATITQQNSMCASSPPVVLSAAAAGGNWSGTGITNSSTGTFDPSVAGAGLHIITYTITSPCVATDTMAIQVLNTSNATITQQAPLCSSAPAVNLTAAMSGGSWSGTGITNANTGQFDPSVAGVGNHIITYAITGACAASDTMQIVILPAANTNITPAGPYCISSPAVTLLSASSGGIWSGTGITNSSTGTFDPSVAGAGLHIITYTITNPCVSTDTMTIQVLNTSNATITQQAPLCSSAPAVNLTAAMPGGSWSGIGITNASTGQFDPSTVGVGNHIITYAITGACPASDTMQIVILLAANANISPAGPYCISSPAVTLSAVSSGGSWSGTGITNASTGTFDPLVSGAGTFTITYGISGACGDTATQTITVHALPTPTVTSAVIQGCAPLCVPFSESSGAACNSIVYDFGDGNSSTNSNPTHCYNQSGNYTVSIICTDAFNCSATHTITNMISVSATPVASTSPDVVINSGSTTSLTASGGNAYNWFPASGLSCTNCSNPNASPTQTTTYCVEVSNGTSCRDTACVTVTVDDIPCNGENNLGIPNAFSPNSDGVNDEFCLQGWDACIDVFLIRIYNRWGEKVYESKDPSFCWDGNNNGIKEDAGVFIYYIHAVSKNNVSIKKRGNISLIR